MKRQKKRTKLLFLFLNHTAHNVATENVYKILCTKLNAKLPGHNVPINFNLYT